MCYTNRAYEPKNTIYVPQVSVYRTREEKGGWGKGQGWQLTEWGRGQIGTGDEEKLMNRWYKKWTRQIKNRTGGEEQGKIGRGQWDTGRGVEKAGNGKSSN